MTVITRRSVLAAAAAVAAPARPDFFDGQTVHVASAEIVLTDILAPSPARLVGGPEPGARIARAALADILAASRPLAFAAPPRDRWGRLAGPARISRPDGSQSTLQAALLEAGAARVFPQTEDHAILDDFFTLEDAARAAQKGIWAMPEYALRDADDEGRSFGFQIYHGAVRSVSENRGRIFFNFGEDFRSDLTATLTKGAFRRWRRKDPIESYAGRIVELRGMVDWINGPSIELRHERQLRLR